MINLTPFEQRLALRLAVRHHIPKSEHDHPEVLVKNRDGTPNEFMTEKLKDPDYVPYCLKSGCGRLRRRSYGFECPTCGEKANYDLSPYNANINVTYLGSPPVLSIKDWNEQVEARKQQRKTK